MSNVITLRSATPDDAPAIARIHVETWRHAYRGIIPDAHLAALSIEKRSAGWAQNIQKAPDATLIAERDGTVAGWISFGSCRDEGETAQAELYAIYIDPRHQRAGIGRTLTRAAERRLAERLPQAARITLWVLERNHAARAFYASLGYQPDGVSKIELIGGAPFVELRYAKSTAAKAVAAADPKAAVAFRRPVSVLVFLLAARPGRSRYLLLHRRARPALGLRAFWQGVSGSLEANETPLDAAWREVREETGIAPRTVVDTGETHRFPIRDEWRDRYPPDATEIVEHLFVAWIDPTAEPRLSEEHDDWRWCDAEQAAHMLTFGNNGDCLRAIERHLDDFQI